jgi:hypothetical protein
MQLGNKGGDARETGFRITHAPGHILITDRRHEELSHIAEELRGS